MTPVWTTKADTAEVGARAYTDPTEALTVELMRLKGRARRLVWLNPLLGWKDYAPVARAMAAALDHIDCFATAHSLASLAALEDGFRALAGGRQSPDPRRGVRRGPASPNSR